MVLGLLKMMLAVYQGSSLGTSGSWSWEPRLGLTGGLDRNGAVARDVARLVAAIARATLRRGGAVASDVAFLATVVATSVATASEALTTTTGTLFVAVSLGTAHSVTTSSTASSVAASHSGVRALSGKVASLVATVALAGRHGSVDGFELMDC